MVPLQGHDFTGLGFNVRGSLRDGIFVKDLMQKGPAAESGKVTVGEFLISHLKYLVIVIILSPK